jgi:hypothetical protein
MADRTWNGIDARLWDEFDALTAVVLAIIISKCPNEYGVYDLPRKFLERFTTELNWSIPMLERSLGNLVSQGKIKLYPKGSVWICSKFKRCRFHHIKANQDAACRDISKHNVETLADFMSLHCSANVGTTDPDPDPDPESVKKQLRRSRRNNEDVIPGAPSAY